MFREMNETIVRRWYEEMANQGNVAAAGDLFAENYVDHDPPSPSEVWPMGAEGAVRSLDAYRQAFPDMHFTLQELMSEGDLVALRYQFDGTHRGEFLGVAATGTPIRFTGIAMWRILERKIVESWAQFDVLDFYQQTGITPHGDQPTQHTPAETGPIV